MTISSSSSPARRDDDDGGVFSDRTESARESITLPDLLKEGRRKRIVRAQRMNTAWATPMRHLMQAGDAHPLSTKTGDRGESNQ